MRVRHLQTHLQDLFEGVDVVRNLRDGILKETDVYIDIDIDIYIYIYIYCFIICE